MHKMIVVKVSKNVKYHPKTKQNSKEEWSLAICSVRRLCGNEDIQGLSKSCVVIVGSYHCLEPNHIRLIVISLTVSRAFALQRMAKMKLRMLPKSLRWRVLRSPRKA